MPHSAVRGGWAPIIVYEQMGGAFLSGAVLCGWQHTQGMATLNMHTEDARLIERKQEVSRLMHICALTILRIK